MYRPYQKQNRRKNNKRQERKEKHKRKKTLPSGKKLHSAKTMCSDWLA
jgi:hypothetical protein